MTDVNDEPVQDVLAECVRQDVKWGQQDHPSVDQFLTGRPGGCTPERMAQEHEIPTATRARQACDAAAACGQCTWGHIAVEELAEAVEAAVLHGDVACRGEVVQLAAVCVRWIESIDRRTAGDRPGAQAQRRDHGGCCEQPHLGLATTRELLLELRARGDCEPNVRKDGVALAGLARSLLGTLSGPVLDYSTTGREAPA